MNLYLWCTNVYKMPFLPRFFRHVGGEGVNDEER